MKKIGIFLDTGNDNHRDFANKFIDFVKKSSNSYDVVLFCDALKKTEKPFATSCLSHNHILSFEGTIISLSAINTMKVIDTPFPIRNIFLSDFDQNFNPINLLVNSNKITIACMSQGALNNTKRKIGENKHTVFCENLDDLVREIS